MISLRDMVALSTRNRPTVQEWLNNVSGMATELSDAVEGIWCGKEGSERIEVPALDCYLIVQWCYGRVEVAYLS